MEIKETLSKNKPVIKFILLCLLIAGYFIYLNIEYDIMTSGVASLLTWSFFVLCTPIADAGFLVDFPLRLLFNIRMIQSEIAVWSIAIVINVSSLIYFPEYYNTTALTRVFHAILTTPYPYWSVILLSATGTFLSIWFGDEMMDLASHRGKNREKNASTNLYYKYKWVIIAGIFAIIIFAYYQLVNSLGLEHFIGESE